MKRKKKMIRRRPRLSVTLAPETILLLDSMTLHPNGIDRDSYSAMIDASVDFYNSARVMAKRINDNPSRLLIFGEKAVMDSRKEAIK